MGCSAIDGWMDGYYNLIAPPSYMRSVVDRNVVMLRIPVFFLRMYCMCTRVAGLIGIKNLHKYDLYI